MQYRHTIRGNSAAGMPETGGSSGSSPRRTIIDSGPAGRAAAGSSSLLRQQQMMASTRTIRRRPGGRGRRIWLPFLVLSLMVCLAAWTERCHTFGIQRIQVVGNHLVSADLIRQTAGVRLGANLWLTTTRSVRNRLSSLAPISGVRLLRKAPHTLVIVVRERVPSAVVTAGSQSLLIDPDLKVIAQTGRPPSNLPVVILSGAKLDETPPVGSEITSGPVLAALRCLALSRSSGYNLRISRVFIDAKRDFWLNVNGFGKVMFGQPSNLGPKLATLQILVRKNPALFQKAQYLDLQNPDAPACFPQPDPVVILPVHQEIAPHKLLPAARGLTKVE
ncbi:MAG: FtsQ-type POTRA domain-containing protein [Armatimonadota bacterium]|nr:FtsQ-type POTRA domain-containing protein [Armatimonadota bacterium]